MIKTLVTLALVLFLAGCADKAYNPHYIISDTALEPQVEP
jgi:hypothetical protein